MRIMGNTIKMPESPGSLNDYISLNKGASPESYGEALDSYRHGIAETLGITVVELHEMNSGKITAMLEKVNSQER